MKLSIISVNLNNRDGLNRTIDSVVSQTFKDFEWIIIDGGSTDGSRKLIEEYSDFFAYWCSEPDNGIYHAMNKGIAEARGDYLLFLNSGDILADNNVLSSVSNYFSFNTVLYGDRFIINTNGSTEFEDYPDELSMRFMYYGNICHQSTFYPRVLFDLFQYNETLRINSDWELNIKLLLRNQSFMHIPITICVYSMEGISTTNQQLLWEEKNELLKKYYPRIFNNDLKLITDIESHLAHSEAKEFCIICEKHRFLSKFITLVIILMKHL